MRVKCLSNQLTESQIGEMGISSVIEDFDVTPNREYTVLGLTFMLQGDALGRGVKVEIVVDSKNLASVPLCLFEVIDGKVSRYWQVRTVEEDGLVLMWPPSFYRRFYHDDLSEDVPEVVEDFRRVRAVIEAEALEPTEAPCTGTGSTERA